MFGAPFVLNPILSIPFLVMPCISIGLGYLVQKIGLVSMGYIVDPSFTPFFAQGFLSALDIRNVIFMIVLKSSFLFLVKSVSGLTQKIEQTFERLLIM